MRKPGCANCEAHVFCPFTALFTSRLLPYLTHLVGFEGEPERAVARLVVHVGVDALGGQQPARRVVALRLEGQHERRAVVWPSTQKGRKGSAKTFLLLYSICVHVLPSRALTSAPPRRRVSTRTAPPSSSAARCSGVEPVTSAVDVLAPTWRRNCVMKGSVSFSTARCSSDTPVRWSTPSTSAPGITTHRRNQKDANEISGTPGPAPGLGEASTRTVVHEHLGDLRLAQAQRCPEWRCAGRIYGRIADGGPVRELGGQHTRAVA